MVSFFDDVAGDDDGEDDGDGVEFDEGCVQPNITSESARARSDAKFFFIESDP